MEVMSLTGKKFKSHCPRVMPSSRVLFRSPVHINRSPEAARHSTIVPPMINIVATASSACFAMSLLRHVIASPRRCHVGLAWLREAKVGQKPQRAQFKWARGVRIGQAGEDCFWSCVGSETDAAAEFICSASSNPRRAWLLRAWLRRAWARLARPVWDAGAASHVTGPQWMVLTAF